ncbi:ATP-dependent Clp protease ATP-binding subunit ClpC [Dictyobacter sp. S3.2.2.5]|uniref:ATP-dependent Clp protease ATP-binding subunit ClpC n=1 Tax=Dictyobacter halimunensis TaxID=3026934 RepID=A0ABQ6FIJ9_9CHLR|nr:ATP-dependent Clp protease ATP-binding subunit ClpC [Dictyobacter sp. S3.2.2.5]
MKCERCQINLARVRIDHVQNGQTESNFLCAFCLGELIGAGNTSNAFPEKDPNNASNIPAKHEHAEKADAQKAPSATPTLDHYGRDLTLEAAQGKLDPIVQRDHILHRLITVLGRRQKNNPVLVGEPGVGKTAIVEGLASRIQRGDVPATLQNKRIISLSMGSLLAGSSLRGQFEQRLKLLIEEVQRSPEIILFIDELHSVVNTGAAEGALGAADIMKPALARGELRCIGATTLKEYRQDVEKDPALERRFQPILVDEPTIEETIAMLQTLRPHYETFHNVTITDEAIKGAVKFSSRYIHDRFLPDKAIDAIDEACSMLHLELLEQHKSSQLDRLTDLQRQIVKIQVQKELALNANDAALAAQMQQQEEMLLYRLEQEKALVSQRTPAGTQQTAVTLEHVARIVALWANIPVNQILKNEYQHLSTLEADLHKYVIGQDEAIKAVSNAIRRSHTGLKDYNRPIGSFLFLGQTGVGKTEMAKALAIELFGSEDRLIRLDMSEYMEQHSVARLFGSPPGYIGYEQAGQLTEQIRRHPYSVVLFDEIEKAHPNVFNALLQVFDDGRLTDGQGRTIDFKNTLLIMTSNIGSSMLKRGTSLGFQTRGKDVVAPEENYPPQIAEALKQHFHPEFLNRIDQIILFHPLQTAELYRIVHLLLQQVRVRLQELEIELVIGEGVADFLLEKGFHPEYGARPLRRTIQVYIDNALANAMITGDISRGQTAVLLVENQQIVVSSFVATQLQVS